MTKLRTRPLQFLLLIAFTMNAFAQNSIDALEFDSAEQRLQYQRLAKVLRCPQCQNQNLDGSAAELSRDLRSELHRQVLAGHTDEEISRFMKQRYGNFILYDTPMEPGTYVLWFGPVLLIVLAAGLLVGRLRQAQRSRSPLSEAERDKAKKLLEQ